MILLNLIPIIKKLNKIENPDLNYLNVANHTLEWNIYDLDSKIISVSDLVIKTT